MTHLLPLAALVLLMLAEGGCDSSEPKKEPRYSDPCVEGILAPGWNGRSDCVNGRVFVEGPHVVCRCPPFAAPAGSGKP